MQHKWEVELVLCRTLRYHYSLRLSTLFGEREVDMSSRAHARSSRGCRCGFVRCCPLFVSADNRNVHWLGKMGLVLRRAAREFQTLGPLLMPSEDSFRLGV